MNRLWIGYGFGIWIVSMLSLIRYGYFNFGIIGLIGIAFMFAGLLDEVKRDENN